MSASHETSRKWGPNCRIGVIALVLAISTAVGSAPASAAVRTDDGGNVPFYARITTIGMPDQIFHDQEWAVIVFYRPPACIPRDFDLMTFFDLPTGPDDPGAIGCGPPTTEGFSLWRNGPGVDPAPFLAVTRDGGPVPVWFIPWPALESAVQDGVLAMGELDALPRIVGSADHFHQVLQPHDAAAVPMTQFVARGSLEDGRFFRVRGLFVEGVTIQTEIRFGA